MPLLYLLDTSNFYKFACLTLIIMNKLNLFIFGITLVEYSEHPI